MSLVRAYAFQCLAINLAVALGMMTASLMAASSFFKAFALVGDH